MSWLVAVAVVLGFGFVIWKLRAGSSDEVAPAPASRVIPEEWGWARVHLQSAGLKALAYYYRDPMGGPSLKVVVDLETALDDNAIREAARAAGYLGKRTIRLGAHETINIEGLPADDASFMRRQFDSGHSAAGPDCAAILKLTRAEREAYGLPEHAPGTERYSR